MTIDAVVGLGYGDEGKGSVVDWLSRIRKAPLVVRYNGGAQAAHNVVLPDGRHHTFAQFGSGLLAGAGTHLSRFMLVNPGNMLVEAEALKKLGSINPFEKVTIEDAAFLTTPFHIAANRIREAARKGARHGSCGLGIGETRADSLDHPELSLTAGELRNMDDVLVKLKKLQEYKREQLNEFRGHGSIRSPGIRDQWSVLDDPSVADLIVETRYKPFFAIAGAGIVERKWLGRQLDTKQSIIFEGAQGVLLDEWYGFQPHTTWTDCTTNNIDTLLRDWPARGYPYNKIGITRAYHTRHGDGPFVTEVLLALASTQRLVEKDHNKRGDHQGEFRAGPLDLVALRYAVEVLGGIHTLIVTCLDRLAGYDRLDTCVAYYGNSVNSVDLFHGGATSIKHRIKVHRGAAETVQLEHQTRLALALREMRPFMSTLDIPHGPARAGFYARHIAELVNAPLFAHSVGPTHNDKVLFNG